MTFMDRVYTLREESCAYGVMKYFISFKDSTGVFQNLNVSEELYFAFRQLERKNRSLQQSDQRHKEFNEVYEETLNRRSRYIPKSVEGIIIETECLELLYKAINSLPEIQRWRFLLYYEYDYNYYEIASMENCTAQAVRRSVIIAREKVKAQMKQYLCA